MSNPTETISGQAQLLTELIHGLVGPVLEQEGVSATTFELLSAVHSTQGKATQARIAELLGITAPTLCESVKVAARQELLIQEGNPRDRRSKRLKLTAKGNRVVRKALEKMEEGEAAMVRGIDSGELGSALSALSKAVRNLAQYDQEA